MHAMSRSKKASLVLAAAASLSYLALPALSADAVTGSAAIYSDKFQGKKTASGQKYDMKALTAASNKFKLGSSVVVTNKANGKTVTVKIIDIEAKSNKDVLDLSKAAGAELGISTGRATVEAKAAGK
jgi:rare lipoprotein A